MPITLNKLPDEPIFVVTIDGKLTADMARDLYHDIAVLIEDMPAPIYRITDVRNMETNFMEMMKVIKEASKDAPGTTADKRIFHLFVGHDKFAMIARDVMRRINPDNHPMLDTVEEALNYIRWQMSKDEEEKSDITA